MLSCAILVFCLAFQTDYLSVSNFVSVSYVIHFMQLARHDDSVFVQHATEKDVTQINMKTNKITRKFEGHTAKINVMKFSLHHMYTGSDDGTVRRWNLQRGTCSSFFKGHKDKVRRVDYHRLFNYLFECLASLKVIYQRFMNCLPFLFGHAVD